MYRHIGSIFLIDGNVLALKMEQAEKGMAKAKTAGLDILVSIIFGIGGKERSREHIVETTRLLNIMKPEQIAPMALAIQPGSSVSKQSHFVLS